MDGDQNTEYSTVTRGQPGRLLLWPTLKGSGAVTERTMGRCHGQKRELRQACDLMSKIYSPKANVIMMSCNHTQQDYTTGTRKNVLGKGGDKG
jgi:hypothetical protein